MNKYNDGNDPIKFIYDVSALTEGVEGGKAAQSFIKMEKELSLLDTGRGGAKGSHGFVFEYADAATEKAKYVHQGNSDVFELLDNNGTADIKITHADGTIELQQVKCGYETRPNIVDNPKYQNQTMVIDKGNLKLKTKLEKSGRKYRESDISKKEAKTIDGLMKEESKLTRKITGKKKIPGKVKNNVTITPKLYACYKIMGEANKAGISAAKSGGAFAAGFSMGKNFYDLIEGNIDFNEMKMTVIKDTLVAATGGYITGGASTLASVCISNSSAPILIASATKLIVGKEIAETVVIIGKVVVTMSASVAPMFILGLAIGTAITAFKLTKDFISLNRNAKERISIINAITAQALYVMGEEREILKSMISAKFILWDEQFAKGFEEIYSATLENNATGIARGLDKILSIFDENVMFKDQEDFDDFFYNEDSVLVL